MIKYILIISILFASILHVSAQNFEEKSHIIKGNKEYMQSDFLKAESQYKIALGKDGNSLKANYNLGNSLYNQKKFDEARAHYDQVLKNEKASKSDKAKALHNVGKTYLDENQFQKAMQNFKESLRLNPSDDETRYNYALAKKRLKEEQEKEKPENKDPQDSDEKGDDKNNEGSENQKENPENKPTSDGNPEKQNQGEKEGGDSGNEEGDGQERQQDITKGSDGKDSESEGITTTDRQEGMLEALRQQEKETLKKIISNKAQNNRSNSDKDW